MAMITGISIAASRKRQRDDPEFVNQVSDDLQCSICVSPFTKPVIVNGCGHEFCETCLKTALERKKECPMCRTKIKNSGYTPLRRIEREVSQLQIKCINSEAGCQQILVRSELDHHLLECPYEEVQCPHSAHGCAFACPRQTFQTHLLDCPYEGIKDFISLSSTAQAKLESENFKLCQTVTRLEGQLNESRAAGRSLEKRRARLIQAERYRVNPPRNNNERYCAASFNLTVQHNGSEVFFKIQPKTPLGKLKEAYNTRAGFKHAFFVDGHISSDLVLDEDTSLSLGLKDMHKLYATRL